MPTKKKMTPNVITKPKTKRNILKEQRELSVLLIKLLSKAHKRSSLRIECDGQSVVTAYTADGMRLYDIWREGEASSDTAKYWIRVQNGERKLVEFGRQPDDGTFFDDKKCNYLKMLYNMRGSYSFTIFNNPLSQKSNKTNQELQNLNRENPKPDLGNFEAWDEERIKVLLYLKSLSRSRKK